MANSEEITILSLCTGYEGLELGLARALENPLRIVAVEIEAYAMANLVAKAEEGKLAVEAMWPDLRTFPAERFRGCFDFIVAGYPCQPFSVAGKRKGGTDERYLWPHICRIIEAVKPVYVCTENVSGLVSARILDNRPDIIEYLTALAAEERKADARGRWYIGRHRERLTARLLQQEGIQALAGVYLDLHDLGYKVEAGLFTAAEVGAPHKRQRLFILAHRASFNDRLRCRNEHSADEAAESRRATNGGNTQSGASGNGARAGELADANRQGSQESRTCGLESAQSSLVCRWPARPGQPQYEWEEPRVVVADAQANDDGRSTREQATRQRTQHREGGKRDRSKGQAQSRVGSAVDGPSSRVDQLRLLGNGVVPQQAAKAFRELILLF